MLLYTYKMNKNRKSSDFYKCIVLENQDFIPASIKKQNQFSWPFSTVVYMLKKDLYSLIPICSTVFLFRNIYWKITLFQELWQVTRQPLSLSSYASIYPSCSSQKPVGHSRFSFSLSPATIKLTNFYRLHDCCFFFFLSIPFSSRPHHLLSGVVSRVPWLHFMPSVLLPIPQFNLSSTSGQMSVFCLKCINIPPGI